VGEKRLSREFKREAGKWERGCGRVLAQAASESGLHVRALRCWVQKWREDSAHAFPAPNVEEPEGAELTRLRSVVAWLKR